MLPAIPLPGCQVQDAALAALARVHDLGVLHGDVGLQVCVLG